MTTGDTKPSFGREVLVSMGFTVVMTVIATGNSVVIARLSGPEGRGLYALLVAILAVGRPFATAGLISAVTYVIGRGHPRSSVVSLVLMWVAGWAVLGAAGAGLLHVFNPFSSSPSVAMVVLASVLSAAPSIAIDLGSAVYLGARRVVAYNLVQACHVTLLVGLNLVALSYGTYWVLINYVIAASLVAIVVLVGLVHWTRPLTRPTPELRSTAFRYGRTAALAELGDVALLRLDYVVMTPFLAMELVGLYAVADNITHVLAWGALIAGRMMFMQSAHDKDGAASRRRLGIVVRLLIPGNLVLAGIAALVGPWLLPGLFGAPFAAAYTGMLILLPATLLKSLAAMFSTYLSGQNELKPVARASLVSVTINVILVVGLVPTVGWHGAAIAKAFAYAVQCVVVAHAYTKRLPAGETMGWILTGDDVRFMVNWFRSLLRKFRPSPDSSNP
jgi:O-antigen/teichoic acid export membrane protein